MRHQLFVLPFSSVISAVPISASSEFNSGTGPDQSASACGEPSLRRKPPPLRNWRSEAMSSAVEKTYLDALDYYRAALAKSPNNAQVI